MYTLKTGKEAIYGRYTNTVFVSPNEKTASSSFPHPKRDRGGAIMRHAVPPPACVPPLAVTTVLTNATWVLPLDMGAGITLCTPVLNKEQTAGGWVAGTKIHSLTPSQWPLGSCRPWSSRAPNARVRRSRFKDTATGLSKTPLQACQRRGGDPQRAGLSTVSRISRSARARAESERERERDKTNPASFAFFPPPHRM